MNSIIESHYPLSFRAADAKTLGEHLSHHNSVSLIGMKRVGISNFLRFFLNNPGVKQTYLHDTKHLFIVIDFNNLVEKTLFAFWMLTLKRIVDTIEEGEFPDDIKVQSQATFTQSIQLSDPFFTLESIRKLLGLIMKQGHYLTLFFLRFDRLQDVITPEFLANLQGLRDGEQHLSYVFTSYRPLSDLMPNVFTRTATSGFLHEMYLKPAQTEDLKIILSTFQERHDLKLDPILSNTLLELAGGHVQFLYLSLIALKNDSSLSKQKNLLLSLGQDEEIRLLSEEIFTSFTKEEQTALENMQIQDAKYLWDTGVLVKNGKTHLFSALFKTYLDHLFQTKSPSNLEMTKKEYLLFSLLKEHEGELVERDLIIEKVWPDEVELGVSDWSIDRLVSRVRAKLSAQQGKFKIVTVITRGYKLVRK